MDETLRNVLKDVGKSLSKHFLCDVCGAPEWVASDQQRWRITQDLPMHCRACFKKEQDAERRAVALTVADKLTTPFMAGEFPLYFNTGGFVYLLLDVEGIALYVGATSRPLDKRLPEHDKKRWYGSVVLVRYWFFTTMDEVTVTERELIRALLPRYNKQHAGAER